MIFYHSSLVYTFESICTNGKNVAQKGQAKLGYVNEVTSNLRTLAWTLQWFYITIEALLSYTSSLYFHHTGSPNITSLTFNGSTNTLTCSSTGGPATTVTWRRNGAVITLNATHQQTKRVVDCTMGTYQTVLTIDPSVGHSDIFGLYNCTVDNARGRSSMTIGEN